MKSLQIFVNHSQRETARTIVNAIGDWVTFHQPITVYIDVDGDLGTYTSQHPRDHVADLIIISEWAFGDRDESNEDDSPLSELEAEGLINLFDSDWAIQEIDFEGDRVPVIYAD